jgi:DNA uptake protein ComE-like DNA-binding protein
MENNWKDYFSFTKKERTGIYVLITLIGICFFIPRLFETTSLSEEVMTTAINLQSAQREQVNTDSASNVSSGKKRSAYKERYDEPVIDRQAIEPFPFDPNTMDSAGWRKLGVSSRTARTIQNYVAKGGQFRKAGDLQKIYGLKKADIDRLIPFVRITAPTTSVFNNPGKASVKYVKTPPPIIDINQADTLAFISLPGIGSKLANRIVSFRDKLGGFYSVQQVGEIFGLPDSTFQLIKPRLQCAPVTIQKININTADVNRLKEHPYIRWNVANAIVQYRQQHGAFHSPEDLQQIVLITPELYQKMAAYVTVE